MKKITHDLNIDSTFYCVCHSIRSMFRVLGIYNFDLIGTWGIPEARRPIDRHISTKINKGVKTLDSKYAFTYFIFTNISLKKNMILITNYGHPVKVQIKEIWNFGPMWQTKYASAVPKNLWLGLNFRPKAILSPDVRSPWY